MSAVGFSFQPRGVFSPCCGSLFAATANDERSSVVRRIVLALFFIANKFEEEALNPIWDVVRLFYSYLISYCELMHVLLCMCK